MRLKPQNSAKQVLEEDIESLRETRGTLSEEITKLTKGLNELIAQVAAEGERQMASLRAVEVECSSRKSTLLSEVMSLEARRAEAMKPLNEKRQELESREARLKEQSATIERMAYGIGQERAMLAERIAGIMDRESEIVEMEENSGRREDRVAAAEEMNRKGTAALALEWQRFRESEIIILNALKEREQAVALREGSIENDKLWLRDERGRNAAEKRAMQSERAALTAAFEEGRKKKYL